MEQPLATRLRDWFNAKYYSSVRGLFTSDGQPHALVWRGSFRCGVAFLVPKSVPAQRIDHYLALLAHEDCVPRADAGPFFPTHLDGCWHRLFETYPRRIFFEDVLDENWLALVLKLYLREVAQWPRSDGIRLIGPTRQDWGTIIQEIRERMYRFPAAHVEQSVNSIAYFPDARDGFIVRLLVLNQRKDGALYSVFYDEVGEQFTDKSSAILAFGWGLSTRCRVRVFSRGGSAYRWVVDLSNAEQWNPARETLRLSRGFWQFWRRSAVRCLQNRLIDLDT